MSSLYLANLIPLCDHSSAAGCIMIKNKHLEANASRSRNQEN